MKIYRINVLLNASGIAERIYDYECKETKNGYVVFTTSGFGGKTTRIKREDILRIDSMARDGLVETLQRYTWYFEGSEKSAKDSVYKSLLKTAANQSAIANQLLSHISKI